jgi:hypothetical protein
VNYSDFSCDTCIYIDVRISKPPCKTCGWPLKNWEAWPIPWYELFPGPELNTKCIKATMVK